MSLIAGLRNRVRAILIARMSANEPRLQPWPTAQQASDRGSWQKVCNICGWHGADFAAPPHSEMANCPNCGSIARDRFLYWCWMGSATGPLGSRPFRSFKVLCGVMGK